MTAAKISAVQVLVQKVFQLNAILNIYPACTKACASRTAREAKKQHAACLLLVYCLSFNFGSRKSGFSLLQASPNFHAKE